MPDTDQASTQPIHLTIIVPGLVPGSPADASSPHESVSHSETDAWPGDEPTQEQLLESGRADAETEILLKRFDWSHVEPVVADTGSDSVSDSIPDSVPDSVPDSIPDEPWECTLMRALGLPVLPAERLPAARLRWFLDMPAERALPQHVVCADPIHLQVERDSVSVVPPQSLSITRYEADACASSINDLLSGDGFELVIATPESWYLTGCEATGLSAAPTHAVARRTVPTSFAEDTASSRWRQLTSELQMLLHTHPVNESRASRGLPPINSVWFCGGDALPEISDRDLKISIRSEDAEVLALAQALGVPAVASAFSSSEATLDSTGSLTTPPVGDSVWVDLSLYRAWLGADAGVVAAARSTLIQTVIGPALSHLDSRAVSTVSVEAGDGLKGIAMPAISAQSSLKALMNRLLSRLGLGSMIDGVRR